MAEASSNDVVAINSSEDELDPLADRPIIQLFNRLINGDNKQSTVLTNAQIVDILDKEFNINFWDLHELEGDIYLTVMKKCLKDWPQWDEFDKLISSLKDKSDKIAFNKMLLTNYNNLKEYLKAVLDRTQTLAKKAIKKMIKEKKIDARAKTSREAESDNIVLEVQSSRNQLNQLFFRRPNPDMNNTIFNGTYVEPTKINTNTLSMEAILNWWDVKVVIKQDSAILYERKTIHQLKHVLVNKNLMKHYKPLKVLPQDLQISHSSKAEKSTMVNMSLYFDVIDKLMVQSPLLEQIFNYVKTDLKLLPDEIYSKSSYRRYTNKYPYIRYMYKDVKNPHMTSRKYDLQLEETVSPMYRVHLGPIGQITNTTVEVECVPCSKKCTGTNIVEELNAHFLEHHLNEPDWTCTNCNKTFPMAVLASNWWTHRC